MTQSELVRAIADEMGKPISQSYLSQIESGSRPHLTNTTRLLLAKFFKVHPGYLVEDPEGYHAELLSDLRTTKGQRRLSGIETKLDLWLVAGSDRFDKDPELCRALRSIALQQDSRSCVLLLASIVETPDLVQRLLEVLRPQSGRMETSASREAASVRAVGPIARHNSSAEERDVRNVRTPSGKGEIS